MAALTGLVVGLYLWRTCRKAQRRSQSARERLRESERAAHARHDRLLQSVQGLILRFHSIATRLPPEDATRVAIETILDQADAVVAAGRNDMLDLAGQPVSGAGTVEALSDFG